MNARIMNKRQLIIIAAITTLVAGVGLVVCWRKHRELDLMRTRVKEARTELRTKLRTSQCGQNITTEVAEARKQGQVLMNRIPESDCLVEFLTTAAALAEKENLTNRLVEHGQPEDVENYRRLSIEMTLNGEFEAIFRFLWHLEQNRRLCRIDHLLLTGGTEPLVHMKAQLSIFYLSPAGKPKWSALDNLPENRQEER